MGKESINNYSVLMSVYCKEKPANFLQSMQSIWEQTAATDDFVLVCDGPLTAELDTVIAQMQERFGEVLHVIRLEKNGGLGKALNEGLKHCKNNLVARMDSDDIARRDRCERQLTVFEQMPAISICSGIVEEFSDSIEKIDARRVPPETNAEILAFAKRRNPFNHPCIMYRKSAVEAAGSYQDFYLLEDYYLWIRMLMNGVQGYNLQQPLLWMRAGSEMYRRRGGWKYAKSQFALLRYMKEQGFISGFDYVSGCMIRGAASLLPNGIRQGIFQSTVRR